MSLLCAFHGAIAAANPPPGPAITNANCYPATGLSSVTVNNTTQLQAQVNSAPAGRHILLAAGTYSGAVTISSSAGTEANPVVIRPVGAIGSPIATGAWSFHGHEHAGGRRRC